MHVGILISGGVDALARAKPELLADIGFSSVFVGCYEDEVRWYATELAAFVRRARAEGLEPYAIPWGYGKFLDPDPSIDSLYVQTHRSSCQVDSRGRRLPKACPNHPRFLEWFSSSIRTLAWLLECGGFVWDEPGFHHVRGAWSCTCEYCSRLFRANYGHEMPKTLTDEVLEFRRTSVAMFVMAAAAAIQSVDRRLRSFVMPTPRAPGEQWSTGNEDIKQLARCSGVDGLCMMVPWQEMGWDMEYGIRQAAGGPGRIADQHGKGCALWLSAAPDPESRTLDALEFAARTGADAVVLTDYAALIGSRDFPLIRDPLSELLGTLRDVDS